MAEGLRGTVKWFSDDKGYGFIERDDGEDDVFFHFSVLEGDGFKTIDEGAEVEFDQEMSPKGPKATRVEKV